MRIFILTILLSVYLPGAVCLGGRLHFCDNELVSVSLYDDTESCACGKGGTADCCSEAGFFIAHSDEQVPAFHHGEIPHFFCVGPVANPTLTQSECCSAFSPLITSLKIPKVIDRQLTFCNFRT